jgi:hypothetical protein
MEFSFLVGLERGLLSLVSTIEELLERKSSGSGLESREYGRKAIRSADYATPLYPQKLALTSLTSGGSSVGIVRSRPQATEFVFYTASVHKVQLGRRRDQLHSWSRRCGKDRHLAPVLNRTAVPQFIEPVHSSTERHNMDTNYH